MVTTTKQGRAGSKAGKGIRPVVGGRLGGKPDNLRQLVREIVSEELAGTEHDPNAGSEPKYQTQGDVEGGSVFTPTSGAKVEADQVTLTIRFNPQSTKESSTGKTFVCGTCSGIIESPSGHRFRVIATVVRDIDE